MPTRIVLPIGIVLLLQACANTPIAEDLETRFSDPVPITAQSVEEDLTSLPAQGVIKADTVETDDQDKSVRPSPTIRSEELSTTEPPSVPSQQLQPYRITIRLSAADPSAPAEMVTRALRRSNVPFAVERIESITPSP